MLPRRCCGSCRTPTPIARARSSTSTAPAWRASGDLFGGAARPEGLVHRPAIVGERFQPHVGARRVDMRRIVVLHRPERPDRLPGLAAAELRRIALLPRSEEHTSELQSLMRISYAVFCLQKQKKNDQEIHKT